MTTKQRLQQIEILQRIILIYLSSKYVLQPALKEEVDRLWGAYHAALKEE